MSIYEASITNPKKQLEFYKDLSEQLQQENKILKENAENNDKVVDKVNWENLLLKKENKQLKECYCNRTDCSGRIKNSRNYDSLYQKYNKQLDNWNKLKEDLKLILDYSFGEDASSWDKIYGEHAKATLKFMEELEQGSDDSNGRMEKR